MDRMREAFATHKTGETATGRALSFSKFTAGTRTCCPCRRCARPIVALLRSRPNKRGNSLAVVPQLSLRISITSASSFANSASPALDSSSFLCRMSASFTEISPSPPWLALRSVPSRLTSLPWQPFGITLPNRKGRGLRLAPSLSGMAYESDLDIV